MRVVRACAGRSRSQRRRGFVFFKPWRNRTPALAPTMGGFKNEWRPCPRVRACVVVVVVVVVCSSGILQREIKNQEGHGGAT